MARASEQSEDKYLTSEVFSAIDLKATYVQKLKRVGVRYGYSIGIKNLTNSYHYFDKEKNLHF